MQWACVSRVGGTSVDTCREREIAGLSQGSGEGEFRHGE